MDVSLPEQLLGAVLDRGLKIGSVTIVGRDGSERRFDGDVPGPQARVELRRPAAARRTVAGGSLGMAESYLDGDWDTPDLDALLDLGIANLATRGRSTHNVFNPAIRTWHRMRDNSPTGSKRNIAYHYDLGNEFYRLWLDETMAYSSALFRSEDAQLPEAQVSKWDRLLDQLQLDSSDHLLEIGCGWGGFAIHAAQTTGCRVTGITLSEEQHAWATRAVSEAGLDGRVDIRLQDYRHVTETFDAIASIEMFEAVGERWWPSFFGRVRDLLKPGGTAAMQVITIQEERFEDYRTHPDFIQRYIFPGGMLPSPQRMAAVAKSQGLTVDDPHFFADSYARTLSEWATRFEGALDEVRALGFDERFVRMWRYYLSYCRAGFCAGTVDVIQVRLQS